MVYCDSLPASVNSFNDPANVCEVCHVRYEAEVEGVVVEFMENEREKAVRHCCLMSESFDDVVLWEVVTWENEFCDVVSEEVSEVDFFDEYEDES